MAASAGPEIVEDGLVLYLDAANERSYPGSGTTWYDLSGNGNNADLVNGVAFGNASYGSFAYDGTNDLIKLPTDLNLGTKYTLSSTWLLTSTSFSLFGGNGDNGYVYLLIPDSRFIIRSGGLTQYHYRNFTALIGSWVTFTFVRDEDVHKVYVNGEKSTEVSNALSGDTVIYSFGTRYRGVYSYISDSSLANVTAHNRPLSDSEILKNHNATRSRFGI